MKQLHPALDRLSLRPGLCFPTVRTVLALALVLTVSVACTHRRYHDEPIFTPVYAELEPNDDAFNANYFGTLVPGDHFFIDGFSTDDSSDPFDGFAFTSVGPVHVDFRLWVTDPFTDLDVCLYDPQLDLVVDCFQTSNDPEEGGVDVTAGGLEFHLIVESFFGASSYSLEITASPLFSLRTASSSANTQTIRAVRPATEEGTALELGAGEGGRDSHAFDDYGENRSKIAQRDTIVVRSVDPETGAVSETVQFLQPDPIPSPALVE